MFRIVETEALGIPNTGFECWKCKSILVNGDPGDKNKEEIMKKIETRDAESGRKMKREMTTRVGVWGPSVQV